MACNFSATIPLNKMAADSSSWHFVQPPVIQVVSDEQLVMDWSYLERIPPDESRIFPIFALFWRSTELYQWKLASMVSNLRCMLLQIILFKFLQEILLIFLNYM